MKAPHLGQTEPITRVHTQLDGYDNGIIYWSDLSDTGGLRVHIQMMKKQLQIHIQSSKVPQAYSIPTLESTYFPYEPYPEQIALIGQLQQSISQGHHALIESPTGSGKTLCLLIGALSTLHANPTFRSKIFYLTRTHSQISQVVGELNRSVYACKMNIIGSREQLCLNHNLTELKGRMLDKACGEMCSQKICPFAGSTPNGVNKFGGSMEEFKTECKKMMVCPYFHTRRLTEKCEVTVMPFNYLLDCTMVNTFDVKGAVLIFDEAHNIDATSEQGSTLQITTQGLYQCILELKALLKACKYKDSHFNDEISDLKCQVEALLQGIKGSVEGRFHQRKSFVETLYKFTSRYNLQTKQEIEGIDISNYKEFTGKCRRALKLFYKKETPAQSFQSFVDSFERLFEVLADEQLYGLYVCSISGEEKAKFIKLRCLDPSVSFKRLLAGSPRCIILSSGTLGSLPLWQTALKYPIRTQITIDSFIDERQLTVRVVKSSLTEGRGTYDFSFQHKHNEQQYAQLGRDFLALESVVPNGIVVAFSTYELMEKTIKHSNILTRPVFFETKLCNIQEIFNDYSTEAQKGGAFLFIIIKGRFSEGINFSDQLCRCLVVVGIPYLPYKDKLVQQKIAYLEETQSKELAELWYKEQTFKPLNQTIGRVIRSKHDYGIILLFDHRYDRREVQASLSPWVTKCIGLPSFAPLTEIEAFFSNQSWLGIKKGSVPTAPLEQTKLKEVKTTLSMSTLTHRPKKKRKLQLSKQVEQSPLKQESARSAKLEVAKINGSFGEISYRRMPDELASYFVEMGSTEEQTKEREETRQLKGGLMRLRRVGPEGFNF